MIADYIKVSGKLEDIRVFEHREGSVQVIMKIDGVLVPNTVIPIQLYEEIEAGKHYDFYCVYKSLGTNSRTQARSMPSKRGRTNSQSYQTTSGDSSVYDVLRGDLVRCGVCSCIYSCAPARFGTSPTVRSYIDSARLFDDRRCSASVVFCLEHYQFWRKSGNLEAWPSIAPSVVIERFSKLHK